MESQRVAVTLTGRVKGPKSGAAAAAAAVFMEQMVGRNERRYSVSRKAKQINLVYNEMLDAELVHRLTGSVHHMGLISAMRSLLGAASLHPRVFLFCCCYFYFKQRGRFYTFLHPSFLSVK